MSETPTHNLLTVKETAEYLRIPLPTRLLSRTTGKIPAIEIGGRGGSRNPLLTMTFCAKTSKANQRLRFDSAFQMEDRPLAERAFETAEGRLDRLVSAGI